MRTSYLVKKLTVLIKKFETRELE